MELPELPKKYNRKEAKIDGRVADWFFHNHTNPVLLEVKIKGGRLKDHQKKLIASVADSHRFKYKFPDGARRTPLDYIIVPKGLDAVLAVCDGNLCVCTINGVDKLTITI
jgi:hypothetical protein